MVKRKRPAAPVAYKHGGHNVPGMFKGSNHLPKHQDVGIVQDEQQKWQDLFNQQRANIAQTPEKRSLFGRIGANIGNIFRSKEKDVDPRFKGQLKHPYLSNPFHGIDPNQTWGSTTNPQTESTFIPPHLRSNLGGFGQGKIVRRRGGSIGPNGTL